MRAGTLRALCLLLLLGSASGCINIFADPLGHEHTFHDDALFYRFRADDDAQN